ncbi:MAG: hypothetical protein HEQ39_10095 [Rhizobacter sp.]
MTASPLRLALRNYLGQELTPEIAAAIESAAPAWLASREIDLAGLGSVTTASGYTIQAERLADILDEIHPLHVEHWAETERNRHGIPLNPDYPFMLEAECAGRMVQFTMRAPDGELVGNLRMYIALSRHTMTELAQEDTLYIKPAHRGGFDVLALIRFAERCMASIGIREFRVSSKLVNRADVLMRRAGCTPVATEFVKFLEGEK